MLDVIFLLLLCSAGVLLIFRLGARLQRKHDNEDEKIDSSLISKQSVPTATARRRVGLVALHATDVFVAQPQQLGEIEENHDNSDNEEESMKASTSTNVVAIAPKSDVAFDKETLFAELRTKIQIDKLIAPPHYYFIVYSGKMGATSELTRRFEEQRFFVDRINVCWLNRKFGNMKSMLDERRSTVSQEIIDRHVESRDLLRHELAELSTNVLWGEFYANAQLKASDASLDDIPSVRLDLYSLFWNNFRVFSPRWFTEPIENLAKTFDRAIANDSLFLVPRPRTNYATERSDDFTMRLILLFLLHNLDAATHAARVQFGIFLLALLNMKLVEFDSLLGLDARLIYIGLQRAAVSIRYLRDRAEDNESLRTFVEANVNLYTATARFELMQRANGDNFDKILELSRDPMVPLKTTEKCPERCPNDWTVII